MSGWGGPQQQNPYYGGQPPQQAPQQAPPNYGYGTAPGYQQQTPGYAQQPPGYAQRPQGQVPGYAAQPPQQGYGQQPPPRYGQPGQQPPPGYAQQAPPGYANPQQASAPGAYGAPPPHAGGAPPYGGGGYNPMGGGYAQPPPGVSPELWTWFQSVDQDKSGKITSTELQQALMNGNWTPFNPETCRLMIGMFDRDRSGTIDIHEFSALWKYIQDWKACFERFDTDRSGNIDANELSSAFRTFGYNLSPNFCNLCVRVFDRASARTVKFDDFIQCCVMLKSLTDQFRQKDTNQSGMINISYEQFLEMVLEQRQP